MYAVQFDTGHWFIVKFYGEDDVRPFTKPPFTMSRHYTSSAIPVTTTHVPKTITLATTRTPTAITEHTTHIPTTITLVTTRTLTTITEHYTSSNITSTMSMITVTPKQGNELGRLIGVFSILIIALPLVLIAGFGIGYLVYNRFIIPCRRVGRKAVSPASSDTMTVTGTENDTFETVSLDSVTPLPITMI